MVKRISPPMCEIIERLYCKVAVANAGMAWLGVYFRGQWRKSVWRRVVMNMNRFYWIASWVHTAGRWFNLPRPSPMVGARPGAGAPHPNPSSALRRSSGAGRDKGGSKGAQRPGSTGTMPVLVQPSEEVYLSTIHSYIIAIASLFDFNSVSV